jgi:hypothetical protein
MNRRTALTTLLLGGPLVRTAWGQAAPRAATGRATIEVFKDASCGCCSIWVEHLKAAGFTAIASNSTNMTAIKDEHKVPAQARSCHTALVGGYVLEGHVPASDVQRLLKERPRVLGLAVPGMPLGSPGMEAPGGKPYDVLTFDKDGKTAVFSTQQPVARRA